MTSAMLPDAQVDAVFASVVDRFAEDYVGYVSDIEATVRREIPEIGETPAIRRSFHQVCADHGRAIGALLDASPLNDLDEVSPGATQFARECAYWGIPAATVLQALQTGAELAWN